MTSVSWRAMLSRTLEKTKRADLAAATSGISFSKIMVARKRLFVKSLMSQHRYIYAAKTLSLLMYRLIEGCVVKGPVTEIPHCGVHRINLSNERNATLVRRVGILLGKLRMRAVVGDMVGAMVSDVVGVVVGDAVGDVVKVRPRTKTHWRARIPTMTPRAERSPPGFSAATWSRESKSVSCGRVSPCSDEMRDGVCGGATYGSLCAGLHRIPRPPWAASKRRSRWRESLTRESSLCDTDLDRALMVCYISSVTCKLVAYYRVSTERQGRSRLGLEGQQTAVAQHVKATGCDLVGEYTEVESSHRDDLDNRPELRKAIRHAKRSRATLVIAKLDRLSRSVYVTAELMKSGVEFVACDNPTANRLTIQILAAVAEHEARAISDRTRAALAAYKARGGRLGASLPQCRNLTRKARMMGGKAAADYHARRADEAYAEEVYPRLKALWQKALSLREIARTLNDEGHQTLNGKQWTAVQVGRILDRIAS
jgi:DNA invertase Pin-like site-specific DNA recombinase